MHDSQAGRFLASPIVLEGRAGGLTLGSCGAALGSSTAWACSGKLDYKKRYGAFDRRERLRGRDPGLPHAKPRQARHGWVPGAQLEGSGRWQARDRTRPEGGSQGPHGRGAGLDARDGGHEDLRLPPPGRAAAREAHSSPGRSYGAAAGDSQRQVPVWSLLAVDQSLLSRD